MRILIGVLVGGGLAGLIAWQAAPWVIGSGSKAPATVIQTAVESQPAPHEPTAPLQKPVQKPVQPEPRKPPVGLNAYAGIWVSTIPGDATAVLDKQSDLSCQTPCLLDASRGTHQITISHTGYETEFSLVHVTESRFALPPITLRATGGILMVTSIPPGARIILNGRKSEQVTPARLQLQAGTHNVAVEKNGELAGQEVQVANGIITYVKIALQR